MLFKILPVLFSIMIISCGPLPDPQPPGNLEPPARCEILYDTSSENWHRSIWLPESGQHIICDINSPILTNEPVDVNTCELSEYVNAGAGYDSRFQSIIYECVEIQSYGCKTYNCQSIYNQISPAGYPYPASCSAGMHRVTNPTCENMWGI